METITNQQNAFTKIGVANEKNAERRKNADKVIPLKQTYSVNLYPQTAQELIGIFGSLDNAIYYLEKYIIKQPQVDQLDGEQLPQAIRYKKYRI